MRFKWFGERWQGLLLAAVVAVVSLWLALHNQLKYYIHPRYVWFTALMALITVVVLVFEHSRASERVRLVGPLHLAAGVVCMLLCAALLVLPPKHLTSSTATQRGVNSGAIDFAATPSSLDGTAEYTQFSVKEWASLLAQTTDANFYAGKQAQITGFVSAATQSKDVFYVSRFVVSCCAVDARPIGVPVYMPGWQERYKPDQWVVVRGTFAKGRIMPIVLQPTSVVKTVQPEDPYVY